MPAQPLASLLVLVLLGSGIAHAQAYTVKTIAGKPVPTGDGGPAAKAIFVYPNSIAVNRSGQIFVADAGANRIRLIDADGNVRTYIGNGTPGSSPDGTSINAAQVRDLRAVAVDPQGALYFTEWARVRKVSGSTLVTVAGSGSSGNAGAGGPAKNAQIGGSLPHLSFDSSGRLLITDATNHKIWRVELDGTITTIAGTGQSGFSGDGSPAVQARLYYPYATVADSAGNIYIADMYNQRVRKVAPDGRISTYAGGGYYYVNNVEATTSYVYPYDLAIEESGALLIKEYYRIRRVSLTGVISDVLSTQNGSARMAISGTRYWLLQDTSSGFVYHGSLSSTSAPTLLAGRQRDEGDGGPATEALLQEPWGLAVNAQGQIYIGDTSNNRIRMIDAAGVIKPFAGSASAPVGTPRYLTFCPDGNLYFVESSTRIRSATPTGALSTVAGNGNYLYSPNTPTDGAPLSQPIGPVDGLTCDSSNTLYFSGGYYYGYRLKKGGQLEVLSETGAFGLGATGKPKRFSNNYGTAIHDNIPVFAEYNKFWQVAPSGELKVLAGGGNQRPDSGVPATQADLRSLMAQATDEEGRLLFSAWNAYGPDYAYRIYRLEKAGTLTVLAGGGTSMQSGSSAATSVRTGRAVASAGSGKVIYEDDSMIRLLEPVQASALAIQSGDMQKAAPGARVANPLVVRATGPGNVPIPGVPIDFSATVADVRINPARATTDNQGLAATTVTLGAAEGEVRVTARSGSLAPVTFTLTAELPKPSAINIVQGDRQTVYAGSTAPLPLEIIVRNSDNSPASGVAVTFAVISGEASLSAATVVTGADGKAAITVKPLAAGTLAIEVSAQGLPSARFVLSIDPPVVLPEVREYTVHSVTGAPPPEEGVPGPEILLRAAAAGLSVAPDGSILFTDPTRQQVLRIGPDGIASVVAGKLWLAVNRDPHGLSARNANLNSPGVVVSGPDGLVYFVNRGQESVYRVEANGLLNRVLGTGFSNTGDLNDNVPARSAMPRPRGIGFLPTGELVFADYANHRIRKVTLAGTVVTLAGDRTAGFSGDGEPAARARLRTPEFLLVAPDGTIIFTDSGNFRVRAITPDGIIKTIAGNGSGAHSGDGGSAVEAGIPRVVSMAMNADGDLYLLAGNRIRKVRADGGIEAGYDLTGKGTAAQIALAPDGALLIALTASGANESNTAYRVVRVEGDNSLTVLAGGAASYSGDGGAAAGARIYNPGALALMPDNSLLFPDDLNRRIRKVRPDGVIETFAGGGNSTPSTVSRNGSQLNISTATIALSPDGALYFADRISALAVIAPDGTGKVIAGRPSGADPVPTGLPEQTTRFTNLVADSSGNLYFAANATNNSGEVVYRRNSAGEFTVVAGLQTPPSNPRLPSHGAPAAEVWFSSIAALAVDPEGRVVLADATAVIYRIDKDGLLDRLSGDSQGLRSDGVPATKHQFNGIRAMVFDSKGDLNVAEFACVKKFTPGAGVALVAGACGVVDFAGDGGPGAEARFSYISGLAVDSAGTIYVSDRFASRIRKLVPVVK